MNDFQGTDEIILYPNDNAVPYKAIFTACSAATLNDGALPYGATISACGIIIITQDGATVTGEILESKSVASNTVTASLTYPATTGENVFIIKYIATLSNSAIKEFHFDRLKSYDN